MIFFETSGAGGLFQRTQDGDLLNVYQGRLKISRKEGFIGDFPVGEIKNVSLALTREPLYKLFYNLLNDHLDIEFTMVSRHAVEYDAREYKYDYRWVEDEKKGIVPLRYDFKVGDILSAVKTRALKSATSREDLETLIFKRVVEAAFCINGSIVYPFAF